MKVKNIQINDRLKELYRKKYPAIVISIVAIVAFGIYRNAIQKEKPVTIQSVTKKYQDTLYSLKKQLLDYDLNYDKESNKIMRLNTEFTELILNVSWGSIKRIGDSIASICVVDLINNSENNLYKINATTLSFNVSENQSHFTPIKSHLISSPSLPKGSIINNNVFPFTIPTENLILFKVEYEDSNGIPQEPIRKIFSSRDCQADLVAPNQIISKNCLRRIEKQLRELHLW